MRNWSKGTTYISVGMMVAGFLLLVLGWNGAANLDYVQGQVPYVISGGIAGLGLIGGGLVMALVQEHRRNTVMLAEKLEELTEIMAAGAAKGSGPTAVPSDGSMVVAGRTSFHRSNCHLIDGRTDLQVMGVEDAKNRGLAACRICEPKVSSAG